MNAQFLADIERELIEVTDHIDWYDGDYLFNRQIDTLRNIARKIGAEAELTRLRATISFTASAPLCADLNAASGLTPAGGTPQPHQISGDLAEAERACAPGGDAFHEVTNAR